MDWEKIIAGVVSVIVSVLLSTAIAIYREKNQNNGVRQIAVNILELFLNYAKSNNTYDVAMHDFNNKFTIPEKRAVIVALHKIGIPVAIPTSSLFNISSIEFLSKTIDRQEIKGMIEQIKKGNCDRLFHADVESHFTEGFKMRKIRDIAKRYVSNVMALSSITRNTDNPLFTIKSPDAWVDKFTTGEIKTILTFIQQLADSSYYDSQGNIKTDEIKKLTQEVECGMWDNYLLWDNAAYQNLLTQKKSSEANIQLLNYLQQPQK